MFRWLPAKDPDGDQIADYHFELSDRPDMKWPLSTNFYKLISNTPDRGKDPVHASPWRAAGLRPEVLLASPSQG